MPKPKGKELWAFQQQAGPGVQCYQRRASAGPRRQGQGPRCSLGGGGQLRVRLARCRHPVGPGELSAPRCTSSQGPGPGKRGGPGWRQLGHGALSQAWQRKRGAGSPARAEQCPDPASLRGLDTMAGPPWASVSLHRARQSHEQGFWATRPSSAEQTHSSLLDQDPDSEGHRVTGGCARAARQRGLSRLLTEARCSRGLTQAARPLGASGRTTRGRAGCETRLP